MPPPTTPRSSPSSCSPGRSGKFRFRFLHDKNSREFLYYRKKVAEMKKEMQKLQAASQKGVGMGGGRVLGLLEAPTGGIRTRQGGTQAGSRDQTISPVP